MAEPGADGGRRSGPADGAMRDGLVLRLTRISALRNSMLLLVLAAVWLFFYFATNGTFLTQRNLVLLALQTSIVSLAAISAVMLIVTRNFDLSVGSAVAFVGVILALLTVKHDVNPALAVLAAIAGGVLMGAWQGFWVTRVGVSSFIVTLAGMLYFRGICDDRHQRRHRRAAAAVPDRAWPPASCRRSGRSPRCSPRSPPTARFGSAEIRRAQALGVSAGLAPELPRALAVPALVAAAAIWIVSWQGMPYLVLLVALCTLAAEFVMRRTRYGAQLYAIGGNPEAARLSGINLDRVIFWNFVIAGLGYGITGVALTARVSGAIGGSAGLFLELDAIAAAIIGGTSLAGGRGRVLGALLGALLMGSLNNGMSLMNVPTFYQDTARGVVLLLAVAHRSAQPPAPEPAVTAA